MNADVEVLHPQKTRVQDDNEAGVLDTLGDIGVRSKRKFRGLKPCWIGSAYGRP